MARVLTGALAGSQTPCALPDSAGVAPGGPSCRPEASAPEAMRRPAPLVSIRSLWSAGVHAGIQGRRLPAGNQLIAISAMLPVSGSLVDDFTWNAALPAGTATEFIVMTGLPSKNT